MAAESSRRRRWLVPALLLGVGAGAWVVVRRRSAAEPVDVRASRPPVERMIGPPAAAVATPYGPGSAAPFPDGSAPGPEYTIKGNASSRLFHPPSSPYFGRTKAGVWFRTDDDAVAAGFSPYRSRRR